MAGVAWYGPEFKRDLIHQYKGSLASAAIYLSGQVKADISQPGTLRYAKPSKRAKRGYTTKTIYNFTHSRPGNPPYKQRGRLRGSIAWETLGEGLKAIARVGTNAPYGRWLELGTKRMAARPYLRANLAKHRGALASILTRTVRPGQLGRPVSNQFRSGHFGAGARGTGF